MKFINSECKITKEEAHDLLLQHKNSYLWNVPYFEWTEKDLVNLKSGKSTRKNPVTAKTQRVLVTFNNGKTKEYSSIKGVAQKMELTQSSVSNILAGRKQTNKFISITKI